MIIFDKRKELQIQVTVKVINNNKSRTSLEQLYHKNIKEVPHRDTPCVEKVLDCKNSATVFADIRVIQTFTATFPGVSLMGETPPSILENQYNPVSKTFLIIIKFK